MGVVSDRPTAGQASLEYVAALALLAALFVVAAPAVGAPDIPRLIVAKLRLGLCLVASDVCSAQAAKDAGLAPCPLKTDVEGHEVSVTAFSVEVGRRGTLTVTPQSDGSVAVVQARSGSAGWSESKTGGGWSLGPVALDPGVSAGARARVQYARGWQFPDQATAYRFLEHSFINGLNEWGDFPSDWYSLESGREAAGAIAIAVGGQEFLERGQLGAAAVSGDAALGVKIARGRVVTIYGRVGIDGEVTVPFLPSPRGHGREEWLVEYTFSRDGPREIAFRRMDASDHGGRSTETVMRLDLRDPSNLAVARPLLDTRLPWPGALRGRVDAVLARIGTHGTVERTVSEVADDSVGGSASARRFGLAGKLIRVHRRLVEATARTGGAERDRFDCATA